MESVKKSIDERAQHKRGEMTAGRELKKIQTEERRKKVVGQALMWKPTGKIFKTVGLRWVPTGKIFTSSTTKVDSEPTNGSNLSIITKEGLRVQNSEFTTTAMNCQVQSWFQKLFLQQLKDIYITSRVGITHFPST
ncbi:hypothetical protein Tco_1408678 [Tanacetum coccineum]